MHFNKDIQDLTEATTQLQIAQLRLDGALQRIREQDEERQLQEEEEEP